MANPDPMAWRNLRYLTSAPERDGRTQSFGDYENGKKRRYELLFAINGGGYALAIWLLDHTGKLELGGLDARLIGLGMAALTGVMCLDLFAFGLKFNQHFGLPGKLVVVLLTGSLMAGWLHVGRAQAWFDAWPLLAPPAWVALVALLAAVAMASVACLSVALPSEDTNKAPGSPAPRRDV